MDVVDFEVGVVIGDGGLELRSIGVGGCEGRGGIVVGCGEYYLVDVRICL